MPNGEKIVFNWKEASPGNWFVESFKCGNNRIDVPGHGNPCRDAAVAAGVALLVCAGSPGSIACWGQQLLPHITHTDVMKLHTSR